ncbi:MAG: DUF1743 domain-containing protein [Salinirussus sp.]
MTVIGVDDTDSRTDGLCTTFVAARISERLVDAGASVERRLLIRCNPAVEHKTRGNAALAVHTDADTDLAFEVLADELEAAQTADPATNPGGIVAPGSATDVPRSVADFTDAAIRTQLDIERARSLATEIGYETIAVGNGRGLIGALAAIGAWRAGDEWTYECIAYRERERWGTTRDVDLDSIHTASNTAYPAAWDTIDAASGHPVCVPRTPCPVLHAIRGDDRVAVERVSREIGGEPVARRATFVTNQGTDAHLQVVDSTAAVRDGECFRLTAEISRGPRTRAGGHVHLTVADGDGALECVAFEPTKRFRNRVRGLREGDIVTVCGEVGDGTLKLEKFALRDPIRVEHVNPSCPQCDRSMASAGADQGYRCRDCGTAAQEPVEIDLDRDLEPGWYEVPPVARRHVAKPLIRGGFDATTHPER